MPQSEARKLNSRQHRGKLQESRGLSMPHQVEQQSITPVAPLSLQEGEQGNVALFPELPTPVTTPEMPP